MSSKTRTGIIIAVAFLVIASVSVFAFYKIRNAQQKLNVAADIIESIGNSSFFVEADVKDTIPVSTYISIPISIPVNVALNMTMDVPLNMNVPIHKNLTIPFSLDIHQIVPVDTLFNFPDKLDPLIDDTLGLDTKMKIRFWPGFRIPFRVEGNIPVNQNLSLDMKTVRVAASIPISMSLHDSIPVLLDFEIPVNESVSFPLKINTRATISFVEKVPIEADFPIQLKAPVEVDFKKTPLKAKFDSLSAVLREVL
ncbi:MAG: hypothetical protein A2W93_12595 [Bacteroidetes bacterium GWF2_43_63]|nr:MAG: hypothetical protein A2W94_14715 [Bacteroidetes bacterium GWE2_42_42]OFY54200.1 MAG: hypothetical protein A2W93_12595 [Bacteroidetes bacterium GWF2_43_63]HBG69633.1 hypothetical protein [Bacteroidales bacterium]HCB61475.1 hypothetical protein [Bacteroidales bacterium]HCY22475.1 hypothetical protein [Bacteroidales bacterium]